MAPICNCGLELLADRATERPNASCSAGAATRKSAPGLSPAQVSPLRFQVGNNFSSLEPRVQLARTRNLISKFSKSKNRKTATAEVVVWLLLLLLLRPCRCECVCDLTVINAHATRALANSSIVRLRHTHSNMIMRFVIQLEQHLEVEEAYSGSESCFVFWLRLSRFLQNSSLCIRRRR